MRYALLLHYPELDAETLVTLYRGLVAVAPTTGARAALAAAEARL